MSEQPPTNEGKPAESEEEKIRRERELEREQNDASFKLIEEDKADPERGPVVRLVHAVFRAAVDDYIDKSKNSTDKSPLFDDFELFKKSFIEHFKNTDTEAKRYRLYHIIIGSSSPWNTDLFDAEGKWSIATKMRELATKYHIEKV